MISGAQLAKILAYDQFSGARKYIIVTVAYRMKMYICHSLLGITKSDNQSQNLEVTK